MISLSRQAQGLIAINIAAVIFGSSALFGKLPVSPYWIVEMRAAFAALALLILALGRPRFKGIPRPCLPAIITSGVILAIHWVTFFVSVQLAGVAVATLSFASFPMFTVLIEAARAGRRIKLAELLAGAAIIAAVALLIDRHAIDSGRITGAISGLASAITFAWFGVASKKLGSAMSPLVISLYQNLMVALVLLPFLAWNGPAPATLESWLWLALLGVVTTALMHQLYFYALQRLSASTCSGFVALEPVYAILFASLLFAEAITPRVIISGLLIIGSSVALLRQEKAYPSKFAAT